MRQWILFARSGFSLLGSEMGTWPNSGKLEPISISLRTFFWNNWERNSLSLGVVNLRNVSLELLEIFFSYRIEKYCKPWEQSQQRRKEDWQKEPRFLKSIFTRQWLSHVSQQFPFLLKPGWFGILSLATGNILTNQEAMLFSKVTTKLTSVRSWDLN